MTSASIYARQSFDRHADELAVSRQLKECRAFCAERDWTVAAEYVDNDQSATTGKIRPGFERLLADRPERIVVWHTDRLLRLTRDLQQVIDLGVNVHAITAGHLDLSTPAGRAVAMTVTAWAQYEGEQKSARQRLSNQQAASSGTARWIYRPFGFDRPKGEKHSKAFVVEGEAEMIRGAASRLLAGDTLARITEDWNASATPTTSGGRWTVTTVKRTLLNPRLVGRVHYRGDDMGKLNPPILSDEVYDALLAKLTDPRRKTAPSTQVKYLLSGLLRCGACDVPMFATKGTRLMVYRCTECKRTRSLALVDQVVVSATLTRLSQPDALALLSPSADLAALQSEVTTLRDRRDGLAALLAEGLLSAEAVRGQAQKLTDQITGLEREIETATGASPLTPLVGVEDVETVWDRLSLTSQRAVIGSLLVARIEAAGKGVRFEPAQVRIDWR